MPGSLPDHPAHFVGLITHSLCSRSRALFGFTYHRVHASRRLRNLALRLLGFKLPAIPGCSATRPMIHALPLLVMSRQRFAFDHLNIPLGPFSGRNSPYLLWLRYGSVWSWPRTRSISCLSPQLCPSRPPSGYIKDSVSPSWFISGSTTSTDRKATDPCLAACAVARDAGLFCFACDQSVRFLRSLYEL
ncbi:hypothetical protein BC834DRAFT_70572 [Gloeopeniophorella convolvens]|nr:hypothetical protein BC834DRAFT_70572 [Gloeopeniophorella convolvens]